jgi:hypothetical protein
MTLEEVERTIESLQKLAIAERDFGIGRKGNPWAGKTAELDAVRKQRERILADTARERIQKTLDAYERVQKALENATAAYAKAVRDREALDRSSVIMRYQDAMDIARRAGVGMRFESWKQWFEGKQTQREIRPDQIPDKRFPEACRFTEGDRQVVHAWLRARDGERVALSALDGAKQLLGALEREFPELRAVAKSA